MLCYGTDHIIGDVNVTTAAVPLFRVIVVNHEEAPVVVVGRPLHRGSCAAARIDGASGRGARLRRFDLMRVANVWQLKPPIALTRRQPGFTLPNYPCGTACLPTHSACLDGNGCAAM